MLRAGKIGLRAREEADVPADVVLALCEYGFAVRGLNRLQVDTLAGNAAMIRPDPYRRGPDAGT